ncbi:MAG: hypothetical protein HIU82_15245 [Proteobacteria bacterium]|nr:hypothetical protein [Pseudomonadota bacterium]
MKSIRLVMLTVLLSLGLALQASAAKQTSSPAVDGKRVEFTKSILGCPAENSLKDLQQDAANHDRVGFYRDLDRDGCLSIPRRMTGLVIRQDGFLDPWYKVRLFTNKRAYWIDDMFLGKNNNPHYVLRPIHRTKAKSDSITSMPEDFATQGGVYAVLYDPLFLDRGNEYCRHRSTMRQLLKYGLFRDHSDCEREEKDTPITVLGYSGTNPNLAGFTFEKHGKTIEAWTRTSWLDNSNEVGDAPAPKCWISIVEAGHMLPCAKTASAKFEGVH